jgi:3D (Asp-Asp-Asp) domain-containing protein
MKRHSRLRLIVLIVSALSFALFASVIVYASQVKQVTIDYEGQKMVVKTMGSTVKDVLDENHIKVDSDDIVNPQLDNILTPQSSISIKKAVVQTVNKQSGILSRVQLVDTTKKISVKQEAVTNIKKTQQDQVKKVIVEKCKIPFKSERRPSSRLKKGVSKVVRQGKAGVVQKSFQVVYRDGKEVSRKLIGEKTITKPVSSLIEYGTAATLVTSRGDAIRFKRSVEMRATAYSASYEDTGKRPENSDYGITASGIRVRSGVVAVDPRVIPLGTRLYVKSMQEGVPDYGTALAADTGGAIKGNKIDLFFETSREVNNWGVRKVKVYILE